MQPKVIVNANILQPIVDYLQTRPYTEVNQLITNLMNTIQNYPESKTGEQAPLKKGKK